MKQWRRTFVRDVHAMIEKEVPKMELETREDCFSDLALWSDMGSIMTIVDRGCLIFPNKLIEKEKTLLASTGFQPLRVIVNEPQWLQETIRSTVHSLHRGLCQYNQKTIEYVPWSEKLCVWEEYGYRQTRCTFNVFIPYNNYQIAFKLHRDDNDFLIDVYCTIRPKEN